MRIIRILIESVCMTNEETQIHSACCYQGSAVTKSKAVLSQSHAHPSTLFAFWLSVCVCVFVCCTIHSDLQYLCISGLCDSDVWLHAYEASFCTQASIYGIATHAS